MRRNTRIALALCLAVLGGITETRIPSVAAVYAQSRPVKLAFSGTAVPTSLNVQAGTITDEDQLEGTGTGGSFTFRQLRTDGPAAQPPSDKGAAGVGDDQRRALKLARKKSVDSLGT